MAKSDKQHPTRLVYGTRREGRRILLQVLLTLLALAGFIPVVERQLLAPLTAGILIGVLYLAISAMIALLFKIRSLHEIEIDEEEQKHLSDNVTLDLLMQFEQPTLICEEGGRIIWHNRAVSALTLDHSPLYGRNLQDVGGVRIRDLSSDQPVQRVLLGRTYELSAYPAKQQDKPYFVVVWQDRTEAENYLRLLKDEDTVVSYIIIDNLDELSQFVQEQYRAASTEIAQELRKWAASVGGFLKEYERDKFLFLFSAVYMQEFADSKFEILDRIREIRVGEERLPTTVSIGISRISGSLQEKERAAQSALEMALQRGGDQVVVKNATALEFYGGRTKTVQKRTKVRARVIANELMRLIGTSSNVLIMGHRNADYDSIGASVGVARMAMHCYKKVHIICGPDSENVRRCRQILDTQPSYRGIFVDAATAQDLISSDTLLVIVDVNNIRQFEAPEFADAVENVVIIDHHRKSAEYAKNPAITYIEPSASSASELVSELLEQALPANSLLREEADLLLAGMILDTKQFSRNSGARTFATALYLRNEGAGSSEVQTLFKSNLDQFIREARLERNVRIYRDVVAITTYDGNDTSDADRIVAARVADKMLSVNGVQAAFVLCRIDESIHVSARSGGKINVQVILERLGGGGYFDSAGARLDGTMNGALTRLRESVDAYLRDT